ncbi:MAG: DUF2817 domain-containing protein, partial [Halobacteriovoraceae bacterium]|nr:DUF2817 domain-containing protein [Halobacteriovoraceae bacterium]
MNLIEIKPGFSVEGDEIPSLKTEAKSSSYIYLLGGTHGDEVEGVYVLQQFLDWLKNDEDIKLPLVIIPILNVDGYRMGSRVNAHGVDLNRNYATNNWDSTFKEEKYNPGPAPLSEPENIYLESLFKKYPPKLIISFHSWKPILNYNGDCRELAEFLSKYNSYPVADDIGYPTPGSLGTYAPEKYSAPVITYECPLLENGLSLKEIWQQNELG